MRNLKNNDRQISTLDPFNIPLRKKRPALPSFKSSATEYLNALEIEPNQGIFFYLKLPSIIFFATLSGYLVGRFNLSYIYILFIGYAIYTVYQRKIRKFSNSLKSLINSNTRREKSKYNGESVEWMNYIVEKFWEVAEPIISSDIYQNVNRELLKVCPPFLNDLKLTEFTLGSRPPFIDKISFHSSKDNKVTLDVNVGFVPLETSKDAVDYFLGEKRKWNSKIILQARLGTRNSIGINLPILVKEFYFTGRIRAILNLIPKNLFVKDVEICLMEIPDFDFTLVPLKTVDIMDVPGLNKWIRKTIESVISKMVLNPNSIVIDVDKISQSKGNNIGVVCVQILSLENDIEEKLQIELDVDGRAECQTSYRSGKNIAFNEYFYIIIQNVDEKINLSFFGDSLSSHRSQGSLFLKNVHLEPFEEDIETDIKLEKKIVKILPQKKIKPRRTVFNKIRLIKEEQTFAFLNTNLTFFPLQKKKSNSAIVTMKLIGIENLVGLKGNRTEIYSTYCTIIVSPLNKNQNSLPLEFIKNTVSATCMVVSGILKTEDNQINNIYTGTGSTSSKLLPPSSSTFYVFESKHVFNNNCPNYNETFQFFARDLSVDIVSICVINEKTSEIIGRLNVNLNDVVDGKNLKFKLTDARNGSIECRFDFNYIDLEEKNEEIVKYSSIQKITVESVSEQGVFYSIVETNTDLYTMEPFTSALPIKKNILVPVHDDDKVIFKLFKETVNGDVFIGEEELSINYSKEPRKAALILNDHISVTLKIEGDLLHDYTQTNTSPDNLKVLQVKLGQFYNLNEEAFIEFRNQDGIVKASSFTRNKQINNVFTLLTGKDEIYAYLKNGDQSENRILGKCQIPKRFANEKIMLNEFGLSVDLNVCTQTCNFTFPSVLKKGFLEVYINNAKNLKSSERGHTTAFVKIQINDNTVYKTKTHKESNDPIFCESFVMNIDKQRDIFTVQVYDSGSSAKNALLAFIEFPLHNINEGFSEVECKLIDAKTFKWNGSTIKLGFNFCRDVSTLKVKKRGILSDFFNF